MPRPARSARAARHAPAVLVPDTALARAFSTRLRRWFRRNGRDLPWRRTRDPYRVLVSELMLQQTQVARVIATTRASSSASRRCATWPRRSRTTSRRPGRGSATTPARATCPALARDVTARRGTGALPAEPAALRALPGVGAYTAGAVASFAFERRAALVDTNVARVLRRVFAPELDVKSGAGRARCGRSPRRSLPRTGRAAWTHNQALMELGALVCTARARHCNGCPVKRVCATHDAQGCT